MEIAHSSNNSAKTQIRVLLVDDQFVIRVGLRMFLGLDPELVVIGEASNGQEAIQMALQLQPDVILMDLLMPTVDGLTATEQIIQAQPSAKIIILSEVLDIAYVSRAVHLGVMGYLLADFSASQLNEAIKRVCRGEVQFHSEVTKLAMSQANFAQEPTWLTNREEDVLKLIGVGLSNRKISERLQISESTTKFHVSSILRKLSLPTRLQLIRFALKYFVPAESMK